MALSVNEAVTFLTRTVLRSGNDTSTALIGPPGIGKSSAIAAAMRNIIRSKGGVFRGWEAGDHLVVDNPPAGEKFRLDMSDPLAPKVVEGTPFLVYNHIFMPGCSPGMFKGILIPKPSVSGEVSADWSRPGILAGMPDVADRSVIVLDEVGKTPDLFPVIAATVHGGRAGVAEIPGNFRHIVVLGNGAEHRAGARDFTADLMNRLTVVRVIADPESDRNWARSVGMPAWALSFVRSSAGEDIVYRSPVPSKNEPFPSPRSWWSAVQMIGTMVEGRETLPPADHPIVNNILQGRLGLDAADKVLTWITGASSLPTVDEILADPDGTPLPERPDMMVYLAELVGRKVLDLASTNSTDDGKVPAALKFLSRLPEIAHVAVASVFNSCREDPDKVMVLLKALKRFPDLRNVWQKYGRIYND